jgi:hypothetical protein
MRLVIQFFRNLEFHTRPSLSRPWGLYYLKLILGAVLQRLVVEDSRKGRRVSTKMDK